MLQTRRDLAEVEIRADIRLIKRLLIGSVIGIAGLLTSLAMLAAGLAGSMDGQMGLSKDGWLLTMGAVLLVAGALVVWVSWARFRRGLLALQDTRAELNEDLTWISDWLGRGNGA